ncbi:MAG: hypothetical protein WA722_19055, partial [Candidatus Sulfotelmatobacter sp.]
MATKPQTNQDELMGEALAVAEERSRAYMRELPHRKVYPSAAALAALARFRERMPETPTHPADVVRM